MSDRNHPFLSATVLALLLAAATGFGSWAQSEPDARVPPAANRPSLLDGRTFHGEIVDDKGVVRAKDVLTFKDGKFHSVTCAQLGFGESPYWTRVEGKTIHFLVETVSPESGKMRFAGTIRGDQVDALGIIGGRSLQPRSSDRSGPPMPA